MGFINHQAIIVVGFNEHLEKAHALALEIFEIDGIKYVSDIILSPINEYNSFMVAPDGSKEGWQHSDLGDSKRDLYFEKLHEMDLYCLVCTEVSMPEYGLHSAKEFFTSHEHKAYNLK